MKKFFYAPTFLVFFSVSGFFRAQAQLKLAGSFSYSSELCERQMASLSRCSSVAFLQLTFDVYEFKNADPVLRFNEVFLSKRLGTEVELTGSYPLTLSIGFEARPPFFFNASFLALSSASNLSQQ